MRSASSVRLFFSGAALAGALLSVGCASTAPDGVTGDAAPLVGTWRLTSFEMELQDGGQRLYPMGRNPSGYLVFAKDGRMTVVLTGEGRKAPATEQDRASLYGSLVAYTGRYRVEADRWITAVDVSWNPAWVGTEQPRTFRVTGDRLQELTPWFPRADKRMVRVSNTYERVK